MVLELEEIILGCLFFEIEKMKSYFVLFFIKLLEEKIIEVIKNIFLNEVFKIIFNCIYLYFGVGYGKLKLSNNFFENMFNIIVIVRNYNIMMVVLKLS